MVHTSYSSLFYIGRSYSLLVVSVMRATVHTTMRATPMQLVFGRDAIHNVRFQADWQYIKERRQKLIIQNNERENAKRTPHTYQQGDQVMILQYQHRKYGQPKYTGPHTIDRVNDNGTVRLRQDTANGGAVYRTWNIRSMLLQQESRGKRLVLLGGLS
jgi:hypothetical protein